MFKKIIKSSHPVLNLPRPAAAPHLVPICERSSKNCSSQSSPALKHIIFTTNMAAEFND